jgi:large subunit ribosomal protein L4
MIVKVHNQEGAEVGTVELKPEIFEVEPNEAIVHQYVVNYLARQRQGTAATKTRKEVSGGGKKPWRQKGTGRARQGTIRSPLLRGGGTVFGPSPRTYGSSFPHHMKRLAILSVFSDKAKSERIRVLDQLSLSEAKTKKMVEILGKLNLNGKKCLILDEGRNENVTLSCRNLQKVRYCRATLTNGYQVLDADYIVFTKAGLEKAQEVFA